MIPINATASDLTLVLQLREGSEQAFTLLFHRYQNQVYQFTFRFTHSSDLAQDWMQETFIEVWTHRHSVDPHQSFPAYLHVIARNKALDGLKKEAALRARGERWQRLTSAPPSSIDKMEIAELESRFNEAISQLPRQRLHIFNLRTEGISHPDIAQQMGLSKGTVKHQIVLALRMLRRVMVEHS